MIRPTLHAAATLGLVASALSFASVSRADDETVTTHTESTPDMREVAGGVVTLGVSYGISLGVAATSGHQGDGHLYVPVVGPWLDFGDRGKCPPAGSCDRETANRVLIVADGIFQGLGALSIVSGFLFPTSREVSTTRANATTERSVRIMPVEYAHGGMGLAAFGTF